MALYCPLDPERRQIRILHVQGSEHPDDDLKCDLEVVSLLSDPKPSFEAISYCWAEVLGTSHLIVDGKHVDNAPASAVKVLRRFRLRTDVRTFWIDAICIDQNNLDERSQQVALMGDVYGKSSLTLIWLGDEDEVSLQAMRAINMTRDQHIQDPSAAPPSYNLPDRVAVNCLVTLLMRPWFTRLWVLQEVALSPCSRCHWGSSECDWWDFCRATLAIYSHWHDLGLPNVLRYTILIPLTTAIREVQSNTLTLWDLFMCRAALLCSNPCDMVYGIRNLAAYAKQDVQTQAAMGLDVNYRKRPMEVFRDVTRAAILESGDLDILLHIDGAPLEERLARNSDLLSWVPPWNANMNVDRVAYFTKRDSPRTDFSYLHDNLLCNFLGIKGFRLFTVFSLLPLHMPADPILNRARDRAKFTKDCWNYLSCHPEDAKPLLKATFVGEDNDDIDDLSNEDILEVHRVGFDVAEDYSCLHTYSSDDMTDNPEDECRDLTKYRRLFRTENGRIGLGPRALEVGDLIVGLQGCAYPFVLRRRQSAVDTSQVGSTTGGYWLLGICYISEVVEGKVIDEAFGSDQPPEWFEIW